MRLAGAALALVVAVWFGLGVVQARAEGEARDRLERLEAPTPAEAARTADLVDRAGLLVPGVEADLLRAQLAVQRRRPQQARRILERAVREQPDDVEAWARLAFVTPPADRERVRREILRLAPRVPAR